MESRCCVRCGKDKPLDQFERVKKPSGWIGHRATCRTCRSELRKPAAKEYRKREKDRIAASQAEWRENNRNKYRAIHQSWRDRNRDRVREIGRDYHERNIVKRVAKARMREAHEINATPAWADKDAITAVYALASEFRAAGFDVHVDHIVPLRGQNVSGLHVHNNLRVCLASANISKSNKLDEALL